MKRLVLALIVSLGVASGVSSAPPAAAPPHVLIVHPGNPVSSLGAAQVNRMFLKQTTQWPNGWTVAPVDLPVGNSVRESFSQAVLGRSARSIKSHWSQQIFSGRGVPPPERATEGDVVRFVLGNRGAIGYVAPANAGGAKILQVK